MESTPCDVGKITSTECHKTSYIKKKGIVNISSNISEEDKILLKLRTEATEDLHTICFHHRSVYLKKFELLQRKCCDPLRKHKKPVRNTLRVINVHQHNDLLLKGLKVKPGEKLCCQCRTMLLFKSELQNKECLHSISDTNSDSSNEVEDMDYTPIVSSSKEDNIQKLNTSFAGIDCSPLKLHALAEKSKVSYGKMKLCSFKRKAKSKIEEILDVKIPEKNSTAQDLVSQKAEDMDKLVDIINDKIRIEKSNKKQIQLLTIPASLSWTRKKIRDTFNVSDYAVRKAQKLVKDKGILAEPEPRRGKQLRPDVLDMIKNFYENDDNSRIMPGMKDVVSLGGKVLIRKRLILGNLRELYNNFKQEFPNAKVGFSKFCSLRPKWCILPGASGTHSVCVCTIHQNVILLLHAAHTEKNYKDLIKLVVCEEPKRECFLRHCSECPAKENLTAYLHSCFEETEECDTIEFYQWVSTDRTQMNKYVCTIDEFIENLVGKIEKLIPHSFIAKSQSTFIKTLKNTVPFNLAVVLMDFSENYSFVIQDEAQGYHWTSEACTVHPVVIYCRNSNQEIITSSHCIISDDLKHDVNMVYKIQETIVIYLKENYPHIGELHYFSDGCAAQYKNRYNLMNLCLHEEDFNLKAQWSFSATSHGKSECDGVGGTAKRIARKESLQRPVEGQITTPVAFFDFCQSRIKNINFHFLSREQINTTRQSLQNRFKDILGLPGTRSFHNFKPVDSLGTIECRRISLDEEPSLVFNLKKSLPSLVLAEELYPGCYIACKYDHLWYFGIVSSVEKDHGDAIVKFLHPNGPSPSFFWPRHEDSCSVPIPHVLAIVDPPHTTSGRTYHFAKNCMEVVEKKMLQLELMLRKKS